MRVGSRSGGNLALTALVRAPAPWQPFSSWQTRLAAGYVRYGLGAAFVLPAELPTDYQHLKRAFRSMTWRRAVVRLLSTITRGIALPDAATGFAIDSFVDQDHNSHTDVPTFGRQVATIVFGSIVRRGAHRHLPFH